MKKSRRFKIIVREVARLIMLAIGMYYIHIFANISGDYIIKTITIYFNAIIIILIVWSYIHELIVFLIERKGGKGK